MHGFLFSSGNKIPICNLWTPDSGIHDSLFSRRTIGASHGQIFERIESSSLNQTKSSLKWRIGNRRVLGILSSYITDEFVNNVPEFISCFMSLTKLSPCHSWNQLNEAIIDNPTLKGAPSMYESILIIGSQRWLKKPNGNLPEDELDIMCGRLR